MICYCVEGIRVTAYRCYDRTPGVSWSIWTSYPCWNHGYRSGGYAQLGGRLAHRVVYEFLVGPIPDGYTLDHLCNNMRCYNPAHLDVCTYSQNTRRAIYRKVRELIYAGILAEHGGFAYIK